MTAQKYFCEIDFPPSPRPLLSLLFSFRGPRSLSVRGQFSFRGLYCKDLFPWRHLVERDLGVRSFEPWARSISSQLLSRTWITSKSNQSNVMRTEVRKTHSWWRETLDDMLKLYVCRWLLVSGNQQVIGFPCQLAVCHWSPSGKTTDKDQPQRRKSALTFQLLLPGCQNDGTPFSPLAITEIL